MPLRQGGGPGIPSAGSITLTGDVTGTAAATVVSAISGASPILITPSVLEWTAGTTTPTLTQATPTSDVATVPLLIQSQSAFATATTNNVGGSIMLTPGNGASSATNYTGGSVVAALEAPGGSGTEANLRITRAGTTIVALGALPGAPADSGIWLAQASPSSSNYTFIANASNAYLNAPIGGFVSLGAGGSTYYEFKSNTLNFTTPGTAYTINQSALSSTSAGSGAAGQAMSVTAQAGQAATGASNNGGKGATLNLNAGVGGTSGSATAGLGGVVAIGGGVTKQTITVTGATYTCDTNSTTSDYIILVNRSGAVTLTLPAVANGRTVYVKDKSGAGGTNHITVQGASGNIDGASTYVLTINYAGIELVSDGTNWFVIGSYNGTVI
jgi:hypothetical protein